MNLFTRAADQPVGTATRFLFERSFGPEDDGPAPLAPETLEPAPVAEPEPQDLAIFTQDDLDRVRAEALSFGRRQGAAEAAEGVDQRMARALEQIAEGLSAMFDARQQADAEQAKDVTALALAVIRKLFPETSRRHGLMEVAAVIEEIIGRIIDKPKLSVRVSESLQADLTEKLSALAEAHGFAGQISVVGDAAIPEGDCRLNWAGGGATRDSAAIWREIDAAVARILGPIDLFDQPPATAGEPAQHDTREARHDGQ
jgi:flagellar assembly protein FliH